ncbi:uncharacterized protein PHALS_10324 [Plasmopara halstedii]|uniref:Uncharacterized protein n=1 Tax=Plasmopara halstedii TaxID=4781 RepID=A0A0P1AG33_PLAHL|nr:uncharacterized protein PHALS_10324 [Plasmopara halstedii]CEG40106.1 hypothetical protein PHALS_10324 [Plasmopara halstedii]|eukprot:XP_024576475.1 hypothetical protein PHALS_10324 [Plasmopara halstedii]
MSAASNTSAAGICTNGLFPVIQGSGPPLRGSAPNAKTPNRPRDRRERIFHGDFTPSGGDKTLEIDIYEK